METHVHIYMVTSQLMRATACPPLFALALGTAQYSTMAFVAVCLVFDSNRTRTNCGAIEEVNQTVKSAFEQSWLMHLSPIEA